MSAKRMGRHEAFGPQRVRHPPLAHVVVRAAPCLDRADTAGTRRVVHEEKARPGKEAPAPANMQRVVRSMRRAAAWLRPSCFLPSCFAAFRMRRRSGAGIGRRHALDGMGRRVRPHGSRQGDAIGAGRACRKLFLCIILGPLPTAVLEAAFAASSIVSTCLLAYAQRAGALRNVQGFSEQSPSLGETPSSRERARRGSGAPSKDGAPSGSEAGRREDPASKDALKRGGAGPVAPRTASLLAKETLGALSNPLFCAAAIAFAAAITRMMTLRTRPDSGEMVGVAGAACVIVGAAILLFALRRRESDRSPLLGIPTLFRILFPLVATLLLALSIGGGKSQAFP